MRHSWSGLAVMVAIIGSAEAPPAAAAAVTPPPGYTIVNGPMLPVAVSTADTSVTVGCPLGTVVRGGGAGFLTFPGSLLTVNTTAPLGAGMWEAHLGNLTGGTSELHSSGCVREKPKCYRIVTKTVDSPGVVQTAATATCPATTVALGGGVASTSTSAATDVVSAWDLCSVRRTPRPRTFAGARGV